MGTAIGTACEYSEANGAKSIIHKAPRLVSGVAYATTPTVIYTVAAWANAGTVAKDGCTISAYRTVIVVDSMPDTLAAASSGADIEMDIYGAKGSCSVSETVKGTYESDSAQAAETATVRPDFALATKATVVKLARPKPFWYNAPRIALENNGLPGGISGRSV